jgi:hypothetical protein
MLITLYHSVSPQIRASFYSIALLRIISSFFRVLLSRVESKTNHGAQSDNNLNPNKARVPSLVVALGINGLALIITAVVQTASKRLDLYHAVLIIHMLFFLGMTILINPLLSTSPEHFSFSPKY